MWAFIADAVTLCIKEGIVREYCIRSDTLHKQVFDLPVAITTVFEQLGSWITTALL